MRVRYSSLLTSSRRLILRLAARTARPGGSYWCLAFPAGVCVIEGRGTGVCAQALDGVKLTAQGRTLAAARLRSFTSSYEPIQS